MDFAQSPRAGGGVGLDDIEELESHGVGLFQAPRSSGFGFLTVKPREALQGFLLAEFLKHLLEAGHQFPEIAIYFGKAISDIMFFHRQAGASSTLCAKNQSPVFFGFKIFAIRLNPLVSVR